MGIRPLSPLGVQMRDSLPPALRESNDYLAVVHAFSRELDRLGGCAEQVRAQFNPATADILLPAWEAICKLPIGGAAATLPQRQGKVIDRLRKLLGQSEGREWEAQITALIGPGWTYEEHIPGDITSPPVGTLRITLPFPPAGEAYDEALGQIREVTPAHLDIEFVSTAGFVLDESELDLEGFGA